MTELPDERRWRQRVPLTALRGALIFGLVSLLVIEVAVADPPCTFNPDCRLPLGSWQAAVAAALQFGVLATAPCSCRSGRASGSGWPR